MGGYFSRGIEGVLFGGASALGRLVCTLSRENSGKKPGPLRSWVAWVASFLEKTREKICPGSHGWLFFSRIYDKFDDDDDYVDDDDDDDDNLDDYNDDDDDDNVDDDDDDNDEDDDDDELICFVVSLIFDPKLYNI